MNPRSFARLPLEHASARAWRTTPGRDITIMWRQQRVQTQTGYEPCTITTACAALCTSKFPLICLWEFDTRPRASAVQVLILLPWKFNTRPLACASLFTPPLCADALARTRTLVPGYLLNMPPLLTSMHAHPSTPWYPRLTC